MTHEDAQNIANALNALLFVISIGIVFVVLALTGINARIKDLKGGRS